MSGFTWHGGRLAEARAVYGGDDWIDLSTGISPLTWPGGDHLTVDWRHLPDPRDLAAMEAAAAASFGVHPDHLCAVPGSEAGLRLVGRMLDMPARWLLPSYRTHAEVFAQGAPMHAGEEPPGEAVALLLANPNNPDGRILSPFRLLQWLARLEDAGGWLIVDEAYADAVPSCSLASAVGDQRRLILLRSFGKFFGLAGVRLGFLLGPREFVARMRGMLGEWPVSAAAIAFGNAAYQDRRWIDGAVAALEQQAAQLDDLLARHGLKVRGECPLFRLVEGEDGLALFDRLARRSILTRPFQENRRWLRLGLPANADALARLDWALANG